MFVAARTLHVGFILFVCSYVVSSSIGKQSTTETRPYAGLGYVELQKKAENMELHYFWQVRDLLKSQKQFFHSATILLR